MQIFVETMLCLCWQMKNGMMSSIRILMVFFYITRRLLKHMMPRKRGGRIINMSSLSGLKGMAGQVNYSTAKAALIGATKALAQEVAPVTLQ